MEMVGNDGMIVRRGLRLVHSGTPTGRHAHPSARRPRPVLRIIEGGRSVDRAGDRGPADATARDDGGRGRRVSTRARRGLPTAARRGGAAARAVVRLGEDGPADLPDLPEAS